MVRRSLTRKIGLVIALTALAGCSGLKIHEKTSKHPNGTLATSYHYYVNSEGQEVPHGVMETWYENGVLSMSTPYVDGKICGKVVVYPRTRELQYYTYRNGVQNGIAECLYPDGAKKWTGYYVDGKLSGRFTRWTEAGKVVADGVYRADQPFSGSFLMGDRIVRFDKGQVLEPGSK